MELFKQAFAQGSTYPIVHELVQNLAFTVLLFEQRAGKKSSPNQSSAQAWNFKPSIFSKSVVLDLLNLCLTTTNEVFRFVPDILSIFELQIAPTLEPLLN